MEERIRTFVDRMLRAGRYGGRCIMRDEHTILLYDVASWGDAQTRALQARFPECEVTCEANTGSLSGFVVVIRLPPQPVAPVLASLFVLAVAGVAYTVHWLVPLLSGRGRPL